jgi:hypothetical protein
MVAAAGAPGCGAGATARLPAGTKGRRGREADDCRPRQRRQAGKARTARDFGPCRLVSGTCDAGHMKSWFTKRNTPAPGPTDDELPGRAIPVASRACCCPAAPTVTAVMPPTDARRHPVDLLLCGHHYRVSEAALRAAGATAHDRDGTLILLAASAGQVPDCESVPAGSHQVTR